MPQKPIGSVTSGSRARAASSDPLPTQERQAQVERLQGELVELRQQAERARQDLVTEAKRLARENAELRVQLELQRQEAAVWTRCAVSAWEELRHEVLRHTDSESRWAMHYDDLCRRAELEPCRFGLDTVKELNEALGIELPSRKFTEEQLSGIYDPESSRLPLDGRKRRPKPPPAPGLRDEHHKLKDDLGPLFARRNNRAAILLDLKDAYPEVQWDEVERFRLTRSHASHRILAARHAVSPSAIRKRLSESVPEL